MHCPPLLLLLYGAIHRPGMHTAAPSGGSVWATTFPDCVKKDIDAFPFLSRKRWRWRSGGLLLPLCTQKLKTPNQVDALWQVNTKRVIVARRQKKWPPPAPQPFFLQSLLYHIHLAVRALELSQFDAHLRFCWHPKPFISRRHPPPVDAPLPLVWPPRPRAARTLASHESPSSRRDATCCRVGVSVFFFSPFLFPFGLAIKINEGRHKAPPSHPHPQRSAISRRVESFPLTRVCVLASPVLWCEWFF